METKNYLDKVGLELLIERLNLRNRNRVKYKGNLALNADTRTDWQDLGTIGCSVGDIYRLTGGDKDQVVLDDVKFKTGMWIIVETFAKTDDDGNIVDRDGNPEQVQVEILGGASGDIFEYVDELPEDNIDDQLIYALRDGDNVKCYYFDKEEDTWRQIGTDAIEIVDKLPQEDINDKIFYVIPHVPGYAYGNRKYYGLLDGSTNEIKADGIYDDAGQLLLRIKDITSEADVLTYCKFMTSMDQTDSLPAYILAYEIVYDDGNTEVVWCTNFTTPHGTDILEWLEHNDEKDFAVYVYNAESQEWNCIYPAEAEAVRWIRNIDDVDAPKDSMLYGIRSQTDIQYFKMPDAEKDAGSTITPAGVTLVNAGVTLTYADIAADPTGLMMTYGFSQVDEDDADEYCVVEYKIDGEYAAAPYDGFEARDKSEIYVYNGTQFEIIYPPEPSDDVVKFLEVTSQEYEKILDGSSTENEYEESTIYTIKDPARKNAPEAYFQKNNIWNNKAIIEVDALPADADIDDADLSSLYKVKASEPKYSNIEYYKSGDPSITFEPSVSDPDVYVVVKTEDDGTRTELVELIAVRIDDEFDEMVANGTYVQTTAADCVASAGFAVFKEPESTTPDEWIGQSIVKFDPTVSVDKSQLYFYSPEEQKWVCIFPSAVEFEDLDIDFNNPGEWYPIIN